MDSSGRPRGHGHRPLARDVQRQAARSARRRGDRVQPGSPRGRGARRAGRGLPARGRRHALAAGECARAWRRQDGRRSFRPARRRTLRELGNRSLGPGALRSQGGGLPGRFRDARCRVRAPVDRGAGRQGLVPRHRGPPPARHRPGFGEGRRGRGGPLAGPHARGRRRRIRPHRRASEPLHLPRRGAEPRPGLPAGGALARGPRRPLPGCDPRRSRLPARAAAAGSRRHAVGAPRAPARRRGRRAPRGRRLLPHAGIEGRSPAADFAHRLADLGQQRALRPPGTQQSRLELRRLDPGAALPRGPAASAGGYPHGRAEAGHRRIRPHQHARLRRGGERPVVGLRARCARGAPGKGRRREHAQPRALQRPLSRRARSAPRRPDAKRFAP